jgi:hypothetical protein
MRGFTALRPAVLALALSLAGPAFAGIEEHNPNPGPDSMLLDGVILDRSFEGTQAEDKSLTAETTASHSLAMATAPFVAQELQVKWELARYGVLYLTAEEAGVFSDGAIDEASNPHRDIRPDSDRRRADESAPQLDESRSALTADEQAAGCQAGGGAAPVGLAALLLAAVGVVLPRPARRRARRR